MRGRVGHYAVLLAVVTMLGTERQTKVRVARVTGAYHRQMDTAHLVRQFWRRVWSEGDVEFASEFFAPTYLENERERTPGGHATGAREFRALFPDFAVAVTRLFSAGDLVVTRVRYHGTYAGGIPGIASTGQRIDVGGVDAFRFEGDKVAEHLHEADHEAMWEQLGVRLPPEA